MWNKKLNKYYLLSFLFEENKGNLILFLGSDLLFFI